MMNGSSEFWRGDESDAFRISDGGVVNDVRRVRAGERDAVRFSNGGAGSRRANMPMATSQRRVIDRYLG